MDPTSKPPQPKSLKELLQATPKELQEHTKGIELPEPEQIDAERLFLQTLLQPPPTAERGWLVRWAAMILPEPSQFRLAVSLATLILLVGGGSMGWWLLSNKNKPLVYWRAKGHETPGADKQAALHVGLWDAKKQRLQRLAHGARCSTKQSLVFGFSIEPPGGYVYLFLLNSEKGVRLIYPFVSSHPFYYQADRKMRLLKHNKVIQQYQLRHQAGRLSFLFLQTRTPLASGRLNELLQVKRLGSFKAVVTRLRRDKLLMASDRFAINVEKS